jgi:hypothetical protein
MRDGTSLIQGLASFINLIRDQIARSSMTDNPLETNMS